MPRSAGSSALIQSRVNANDYKYPNDPINGSVLNGKKGSDALLASTNGYCDSYCHEGSDHAVDALFDSPAIAKPMVTCVFSGFHDCFELNQDPEAVSAFFFDAGSSLDAWSRSKPGGISVRGGRGYTPMIVTMRGRGSVTVGRHGSVQASINWRDQRWAKRHHVHHGRRRH